MRDKGVNIEEQLNEKSRILVSASNYYEAVLLSDAIEICKDLYIKFLKDTIKICDDTYDAERVKEQLEEILYGLEERKKK